MKKESSRAFLTEEIWKDRQTNRRREINISEAPAKKLLFFGDHSIVILNLNEMVFQFINEDVACQHRRDCVFSSRMMFCWSPIKHLFICATVPSQLTAASLFTNFSWQGIIAGKME